MPLLTQVERASRRLLERTLACVVLRRLPHGFDACYDLRRRMPDARTIVDVGANVGQSALLFARVWPAARIHAFEPIASTFERLVANVSGCERITPVHTALGARAGTATVDLQRGASNNSISYSDAAARVGVVETVSIDTLDRYARDRGLERIDLLKVDCEGYDLEVLRGAEALLSEGRIGFVQAEAGMNPANEKHVPLGEIQSFLEGRGYVLFGLYEQRCEWSGPARLRYCNPVFVHTSEVERPAREDSVVAAGAWVLDRLPVPRV